MKSEIKLYIESQEDEGKQICKLLQKEISAKLTDAENKIWHAHPVWFLNGNPIVGYSKLKNGIRLLFWSGIDFQEKDLRPGSGKFKDASITYQTIDQVNINNVHLWLKKARDIQWDYKNIVKRKGVLVRLT